MKGPGMEGIVRALLRDKTRLLIAAAGLLGLALLLLGGSSGASGPAEPEMVDDYNESYRLALEQRLGELVGSIAGAGETRVMVALESGVRYVYAEEEKSDLDQSGETQKRTSERSVTVVGSGEGERPLQLTVVEPTVAGVAVVCGGGGQIQVKQAVIEAVSTVLGIPSSRVSVAAMN